jgi:soluble lytic murein transglycosylase-like protein
MKTVGLLLTLLLACPCWPGTLNDSRQEAEYYVAAYARHYGVPVEFVRAVVEQESRWRRCAVSSKGAVGLMQLMPGTAARLNVRDRCDLNQNVSGGVRYLAWLMNKFHGDLRLVAAAYYTGERVIEARGLQYANRDVVAYVASIRMLVERQRESGRASVQRAPRRTR